MIFQILVCFFFNASLVAASVVNLGEIQVLGHEEESSLVEFVPSAKKLKEKELRKRRQATVGDTLQSEAGIQSTSFGPNSSRPVIRGLDGARIKVLQNSLSTLDASTQSLDHNIPVDTMLIDQIEIVRGPMGLLYGTSAIGGVVNIATNRTHSKYQDGVMSEIQAQGETVNNGLSEAARLDYGKNNWMIHLDGSTKNFGDTKIPKFARSSKERQANPLPSGQSEEKNKIDNSLNQQNSLGVGATRFFNKGFLGLSFGHFDSDYGSVVEKDVIINMIQNRFELSGEYHLNKTFKKIKLRSAQSDYRHKEIANNITGTVFKNKGNETRLEATNESKELRGVTGIQSQIYNFSANGDEAFLPETNNTNFALFSFQEYSFQEQQSILGSLRAENSKIDKVSSTKFPGRDDFSFLSLNGSAGYQYKFTQANSLTLTYSYTERAPTFQELLSDGEHVATGTFEIGNTNLKKEHSQGLELSFKHFDSKDQWTANVYAQKYHDYISLNPTGTQTNPGFDDYAYARINALFYGIDVDGRNRLYQKDNGTWYLLSKFDYIRAKDTTNDSNLPRISPARISAGLEYQKDNWSSDVEGQYVFAQAKTAPNELRTSDYIMTNIGTQYSFITERSKLDLFLRIRNLFDVEARNHVSFLKDKVPLAGRNIILGVQWLI